MFPVLAACTIDPGAADPTDVQRGQLGKTDVVGSCQLEDGDVACGDMGTGNCWCDEQCVDYGDCCSDVGEVCGIDVPAPEGQPCGGLLGLACDEGEFCHYEPGQFCGAADATGMCMTKPEVCIEIYAPVCGCDDTTYANSCFAAAAGVGISHEGECEQVGGQFCGGFGNLPCPDGFECVDDANDDCDPANGGADCGGVCVPEPTECGEVMCALYCEYGFQTNEQGCEICSCNEAPKCEPLACKLDCEHGLAQDENGCDICECADAPTPPEECQVGGCSGELCVGPEGPGISICIYEPWYECLALSKCGNYGEDGACGWKPTAAFKECLAQHGA